MVVTTILVRNTATAPLLRLTIDETWYDKAGGLVTGGKGVHPRLEAGEVGTVKIETPWNAKMSANNYNFAHANGTVKPRRVDKLVPAADAKEPATKPAASEEVKNQESSIWYRLEGGPGRARLFLFEGRIIRAIP